MDKRFLFLYNPISGGAKSNFVEIFEKTKYLFPDHAIMTTTHVGHARELASQYKNEYDVIVAVGGDGTINEIASELVHTNTKLGIIPVGSANGLAFHLGIPMNVEDALKKLKAGSDKQIDIIEMDDRVFVNVAGVGFDGHVNTLFNQTKLRGLWSYAKLVFTEYIRYKEFEFTIVVDEVTYIGSAFFIVFGNSTQYGHNFHIVPNANSADGILHVTLVRKPPFVLVPFLLRQVFKGKALDSKYCTEVAGKEVTLHYTNQALHLDGEVPPDKNEKELHFRVLQGALGVIC